MMSPRRLLPAVLALAWLLPAFGAGESGPRLRPAPALDTANARVIVKYRDQTALMRIQSATPAALPLHADTMGKRVGLVLTDGHVLGARTQSLRARGIGSAALAARLAAQPDVEWAVPAYRRLPTAAPNDPLFGPGVTGTTPVAGQWYLRAPSSTLVAAIDAVTAWDTTQGLSTVTVAVLDTGVTAHPDLAGKLLQGHDFVSSTDNTKLDSDNDPSDPGDYNTTSECELSDSSWHGTQTAGLIGAATNNGIGMAGVGRNVMVLPVRVLGRCGGYDDDIIAGMRWAGGLSVTNVSGIVPNATPAKVINMSLGSPGACTAAYSDAIAALNAAGVTGVVASGNEGDVVGTPANCPGALAVSGVRHEGTKVGYSNVGPQNFIAAPAGNCVNDPDQGLPCLYPILSTTNSGRTTPAGATYTDSFNYAIGTSFSSPLVAGVIGLMLSRDPALTPARIREVLKATARPFPTTSSTSPAVAACRPSSSGPQASECYCTTSSCGAGMLDARAAVNAVGTGGVMPPLITINASNTAPARGASVNLDASGTRLDGGRTVATYVWSVTGGADIGEVTGALSTPSTTVMINRAGEVTVQLVVTDVATNSRSTSSVTLYAQEPPADSGGGGGAMSTLWNALVGLAVVVLAWQRRRPARG